MNGLPEESDDASEALPTEMEVFIGEPTPLDMAAELASEGIIIELDGVQPEPEPETGGIREFTANLAEFLDEKTLDSLSQQIVDWAEQAITERESWYACLEKGMETLGIAALDSDDRPFDGASTVTHPLVAESAVQFQSRAIEEFFPSAGPVKAKTVPGASLDVIQQGERVAGFFNHYLTDVDEGYYDDSDKMLFRLALEGHVFRKVFRCPITGKAKARFVTAGNLLVPYESSSLADAEYAIHRYYMPLNDLKRAMRSGHFKKYEFDKSDFGGIEQNEEKTAEDESDRRDAIGTEGDTPEIYEAHCEISIPDDPLGDEEISLPYIVTVEKNTRKVLSVYRNWKMDDERKLRRTWFASYKYLQGLGFYGLGLYHVLGNLAASAGSMLRSIIDAAALNNLQGGFVAKQGGGKRADLEIEHGVWKEVDMTPEELQKAFYTPPFKEPSQTLMLTMRMLIESAQRFSSTTESMVGEGPNTGPVGTTLALIEQGSKVFSAIHKRIHRAFAIELRILQELFIVTNEEYPYPVEGGASLQQDLDARVDVMPVSDPTITSNTQRIAMAQSAQQIVRADPELYGKKARKLADLTLMKAMKVPNADQFFLEEDEEEPEPMDPVTENQRLLTGKPVMAYEDQEHDAHISAHLNFARALPPEGQKAIEPALLAHIAEHAAFKYKRMIDMAAAQTGQPPEVIAAQMPLPPLVPQMMPPPEAPDVG